MSVETPILLCVFNRPAHTRRVLEAIARQRPRRLFVVGDGPRRRVPADAAAVAAVRRAVETVDWPCETRTLFADGNMGCRARMSSGIDWAFSQSDRLIILEDDCLPHDDFFRLCDTLLDRYADEPRVMAVAGSNFQAVRRTHHSYYFSRYAHIWGWATWRRAWDHYDVAIADWPRLSGQGWLESVLDDPAEIRYWRAIFDGVHAGAIDTWDFQWLLACWRNGGLTALPETNLVSNIGFGAGALHTTDARSPLAAMPTGGLGTLSHPPRIERLAEADAWTWRTLFKPPPRRRFRRRLERLWGRAEALLGRLGTLFVPWPARPDCPGGIEP